MFESVNRFLKKFRTIKKIDELSSMERLGRDEYKYIEGDQCIDIAGRNALRYPKQSDILANNQKLDTPV